MANVDDVAILDNVVFALHVELRSLPEVDFGGVTGTACGAGGQQLVALHHLGADEPPGQIAVDGVGSVHRRPAAADRPRAYLVLADGEETDETERLVEQAREDMDGGLFDAERLEELGTLAGILDLRDFCLDFGAKRADLVARAADFRLGCFEH